MPTTFSAADALAQLQAGNSRFVEGQPLRPHTSPERRRELALRPPDAFATILACADARASVEFLFDCGLGDLFVTRVAGNVVDLDGVATVEFGLVHVGTPLVVVLGHTNCAAVTAVVDRLPVGGNVRQLLQRIQPVVDKVRGATRLTGQELVDASVRANVLSSMKHLFQKSQVVRQMVKQGSALVVGGVYGLADGQVEWLGPHPDQDRLVI